MGKRAKDQISDFIGQAFPWMVNRESINYTSKENQQVGVVLIQLFSDCNNRTTAIIFTHKNVFVYAKIYRFKLLAMVLKMSARNVSLPDELIALVNQKAIRQKRSFSSVVVEALRKEFKRQLAQIEK